MQSYSSPYDELYLQFCERFSAKPMSCHSISKYFQWFIVSTIVALQQSKEIKNVPCESYNWHIIKQCTNHRLNMA